MITNEYITPDGKYHIRSFGNGWAYEITEKSTGDSLFFQDEDAAQLQTETEDFANSAVINQYFECLLG